MCIEMVTEEPVKQVKAMHTYIPEEAFSLHQYEPAIQEMNMIHES